MRTVRVNDAVYFIVGNLQPDIDYFRRIIDAHHPLVNMKGPVRDL